MAKFFASDEDSDTKRHKKRSKFNERKKNCKIRRNKKSSLYCSLHGENKGHTSRKCNVLKKRAKDKDNPKNGKKYYKKNFKELNLSEKKAVHQRAKYLRYKKLNKAFAKMKTPKEETVILDDPSASTSSSSSEADNSPDEGEEPPSPTTQSLLTTMKSATDPSETREKN